MKRTAMIAAVLVLVAFAYFVWPTPWAYYEDSGVNLKRRNRFTDEMQQLIMEGWIRMESEPGAKSSDDRTAEEFMKRWGIPRTGAGK